MNNNNNEQDQRKSHYLKRLSKQEPQKQIVENRSSIQQDVEQYRQENAPEEDPYYEINTSELIDIVSGSQDGQSSQTQEEKLKKLSIMLKQDEDFLNMSSDQIITPKNKVKLEKQKTKFFMGTIKDVEEDLIVEESSQNGSAVVPEQNIKNEIQQEGATPHGQQHEHIRHTANNDAKLNVGQEDPLHHEQNKVIAEKVVQSIIKKQNSIKSNPFKNAKSSIGNAIVNQKLFIDKQEETFRSKQKLEQIKNIAFDLGIDYNTEGKLFNDILVELVEQELPEEWIVEFSPLNNCVYYNVIENYVTQSHPKINQFRKTLFSVIEKQLERSNKKDNVKSVVVEGADSGVIENTSRKNTKGSKPSSKKHLKNKSSKAHKSIKSFKSITSASNLVDQPSLFMKMSSTNIQQESLRSLNTIPRNPSIMNHIGAHKRQATVTTEKDDQQQLIGSLYDKKSIKRDQYNQYREILNSNQKIASKNENNIISQLSNDQSALVEMSFSDSVNFVQNTKILYIDEYSEDPQLLYEKMQTLQSYQEAYLEDVVIYHSSQYLLLIKEFYRIN